MTVKPAPKSFCGYLMVIVGLVWFACAAVATQPAFFGVGAAFFAIGVGQVIKARSAA